MTTLPWSTVVTHGEGMPWARLCGEIEMLMEIDGAGVLVTVAVVVVVPPVGVIVTVGSIDGSGVGTMNVSVAVGETVKGAPGTVTVTVGPGVDGAEVEGTGLFDGRGTDPA